MPEVTTEEISGDPNSEDYSEPNAKENTENAEEDGLSEYRADDGTLDAGKVAEALKQLKQGQQGDDAEGEGSDGSEQDDGSGDTGEPDGTSERAAATEVLAEKGVDLSALEAEFTENGGKLTDESYEKLDKAGFPRALVDNYITGQNARAANYTTAIYDAAGGEEGFKQLAAWAGENLSDADLKAVNNVLASGDIATVRLTLGGLAAQANLGGNQEEPAGDTFIQPRNSGVGGRRVEAFASSYERTKAMQDPRYNVDPAYTQEVWDKTMNMED